MELFQNLLKRSNQHQLLLAVLFVIYILFNIETPHPLAQLIDNIYGNIVVVLFALSFFFHSDPVVGVLGLLAAYELIKRSSDKTGTAAIKNYLPSEYHKGKQFTAFNQFPVTLEEQMVAKMAPLVRNAPPPNVDYKPVLDGQHHAAPINYQGVI